MTPMTQGFNSGGNCEWGDVEYCCTTPDPGGTGNITDDPQLTPALRLRSASPCIDAGSSSSAPALDIDGDGRWDHPDHWNEVSIVDIGADEFVDTDLDGMADRWETNYFGSVTNRDGTADGDGDALDDLAEHDNDTDPGNPDTDDDRMSDGDELGADTDPLDNASLLCITNVSLANGAIRIDWQGGVLATQWLECCESLTNGQWAAIFTNIPPTPVTTNITDMGATNSTGAYRIKAAR